MTTTQPEALRLADMLDDCWAPSRSGLARNEEAAAELRRQHAEIEALKAEVSKLGDICGEAYQVVGSLLSDVGAFDTPEAEKILDNLSQQELVHDDVLPWPSFAVTKSSEAQGDVIDRIVAVLHTIKDEVPAIAAQPKAINSVKEKNSNLSGFTGFYKGMRMPGDD